MLVDTARITIRAGKGGDGVVSWRREKYVPNGGPDGGDGGNGGNIIIKATHNADTLSNFRYRKVFQAENGENGGSKKMAGKAGEDLELLVPVGTLVIDQLTGGLFTDMTKDGQKFVAAWGGKGGQGNVHFATATHQQPTERTLGTPGEERELRLELQLIADVALIGLPNSGKSSLIAALTGINARIGAFAFSTTEPDLGVMKRGDHSVTIVDLPGLLSGAHAGKGLGDKFLQHAKRVKALLHVIDATDPDLKKSTAVISEELEKFDPILLDRPRQLVFNKIDLLNDEEKVDLTKQFPSATFVSAKEKQNLDQLAGIIIDLVG